MRAEVLGGLGFCASGEKPGFSVVDEMKPVEGFKDEISTAQCRKRTEQERKSTGQVASERQKALRSDLGWAVNMN